MAIAQVVEQWELLKSEISESDGLRSLKDHELWARMLTHFTDDFPLVLKLVVITLLIPVDTSECERVFSLMNDLKTSERNRLGQTTLKHTMLWHTVAKALSCQQVPVQAILKEFLELGGVKGRLAHRGTTPPTYSFRVKD